MHNSVRHPAKLSNILVCNERKMAAKPTMHQNSAVSKAFFWKNFKLDDKKYGF